MINGKTSIITVLTIFIISCTSLQPKELRLEEPKLKEKLIITQSREKSPIKQIINVSKVLTLDQVITCIKNYNPRLQASKAVILEVQGSAQQQMLYPNPVLGFESEDMPLDNFGNFGRAENSVILRQRFIMPWKRNATQATLNKQIDIVKQDYIVFERN